MEMKTFRSPCQHGGFTLVETVVAVGLLIVIVLFSTPLLTNVTNFYNEAIFRSNLKESAVIAQERILDDLISAKIVSLDATSSNPSVVFTVPVEQNNGTQLDFLDPNGDVYWGAVEASGPMVDTFADPHRLTLRVLSTGSISEEAVHTDLNHDGDTLDTFLTGSLALRTTGGVESVFGQDRMVLSQAGGVAFDMDGDKISDPIFTIVGETFVDSNGNGMYDQGESFVDVNSNSTWDGYLRINMLTVGVDRSGHGHQFYHRANIQLHYN
ncbi:MAG: hypothetical protein HY717_19460 [Planctomycetes bacterium]|nr:hypothetical protein [Planctomycetota bacterium]